MAVLIFFAFLLHISNFSIGFRYLDHLVANRMAPSMCSTPVERDVVVGFKQFCTIFLPHIWCLCDPHIIFKCCMKLTCLPYILSAFERLLK